LARDRNLHQVESLISSIQSLQKTARENLRNYQQEAAERKRAGRKLHASLQADITESENKLAKLQLDLVKAQEKAAAVKASYEADKVRFRELSGSAKK
jgi:predicted nuclease with TOPRIM domain